jgi:hypothetical protein
MKVKILKHPFILQAIVAIFGFLAFLTFKSGIFDRIFFSQNGENFPPIKSLSGLCLYARPTYSLGSEHYMLKLGSTFVNSL